MFNRTQEKIVVRFMFDHPEVGKGHQTNLGPNGKIVYRQLLDRLLQDVNCAGPAMTIERLLSAWTAKRLSAKEKLPDYRNQKKETGNEPMTETLTDEEKTICNLFKNFALPTFLEENFGFGHCWLSALDRVAAEAKTRGVKNLSAEEQRMYKLLKEAGKENFSVDSCEAKLKKFENLKNVGDEAAKELLDAKMTTQTTTQEFYPKSYCTNEKKSTSGGSSINSSITDDCSIVSPKEVSTWSSDCKVNLAKPGAFDEMSETLASGNTTSLTFIELKDKVENNTLNLAFHSLREVPADVALIEFTQIRIEKNSIVYLPDFLTNMISLTRIEVQENSLESLPDGIGRILDLKHFNVPSHKLTTLPLTMALLNKVKHLSVNANPLEESLADLAELPYNDDKYVVNMGDKTIQELSNLIEISDTLVKNQKDHHDSVLNILMDIRNDNREFYSYIKSQSPVIQQSPVSFENNHGASSNNKENEAEEIDGEKIED
ncbi:hypothetical protein QAD02_003318 [Eretmocerus hayati]|uniref:Uncharacterized protein n=1 Tax=Eretmocerus hayati TaxID=131215 RepID=A0ACC2NLT2_9HYME|nr:hypothetical protein QAD02_003318 [Eretmocerus hayati]